MENQHQNQDTPPGQSAGQGQQQGQHRNQEGQSYTDAQHAPQGTGSYGSGYGQADQAQSGQTGNQQGGDNGNLLGNGSVGTGQYARDEDADMDAENNPSASDNDDTQADMDDTTGSNYRDSDSTSNR